ncbi:MAG: carboxypeptidase-like regulatory domain-containing protein [Acidobacteriota bacterium]
MKLRAFVACVLLIVATGTALSAQPWRPVTGEIRGLVRTPGGTAIEDAKVWLSGASSAEASTGEGGAFAFPGLAPGRYTVEVGAEGRVSSWAEEIDVSSAAAPFLVVELAEGKETSVTVTFAPVLDSSPTGPVWRLSREALVNLPSGGSARRLAGLLTLGPEPSTALLEGNGPGIGGRLLETYPAEWLAALSSPADASSAAVAGGSFGEELVLETQRAADAWTGGAWISHQSRTFEGRDRRRPEVSGDGELLGVRLDEDRTAERLALSGTGRLGRGWSLGLGQRFGQQAVRHQLDPCATCSANPVVGTETEADLVTGALRHEGRFALAFHWTEAEDSSAAMALDTIGRSRDDEQQRGARFALPVGRRGLLGLTLGDRRSRASREGYFPGASGRSTAAGEGGTPRRGPGSEDLISPGEAAAFEAREDLTVRWQQQLGGAELRFGGGRSRADVADASSLQQTFLLWGVLPAVGGAPKGHSLTRVERRDAAARTADDSAWVEARLWSPRAVLLGGIRWQGGELRDAAGVSTTHFADAWLSRLAVAFDPRGEGQERFLFSVGRVAAGSESVVPFFSGAATDLSLLGRSLEGRDLFAGSRPSFALPRRLSPERSTLWTGSAEHLLLPGLVVGATARYREVDRGLRVFARETAWSVERSDAGLQGADGACARALASARLWATWKGGRSELFLAADSRSRHGLRTADCQAAQPALPRFRADEGRAEEQRVELLAYRQLRERWSLGTTLYWQSGAAAPLGALDVVREGEWLALPTERAVSSRSAWRADAALHYRIPTSDDGDVLLTIEALNLFDGRGALGEGQRLSLSPDVGGLAGARDPRAGQPVVLQSPRAVRFRVGWRW